MAETVEFELVSPAKLLKSEPVEMVVVPGADGDVGVLPGHSPLIASLRPGTIDIHAGGKVSESLFVAGGFVEVSETRCTVLAEEATPVAELDKAACDQRLTDAQASLASAEDGAKPAAEKQVRVAEAMVAAAAKG
ncbi:MAG: ATP synthase F1 subunit epsilon [Magnetovibrionaceae bacterium]